MSTYDDLVDEILANLQGFTHSSDTMTALSSDVTASDTTLPVEAVDGFEQGIIEIGDELIWVQAVDTNSLSAASFGRGFRGTTAAIHTSGTAVRMSPIWPRSVVQREVNKVLRSLYPKLFGVASTTFTSEAAQFAYELPATAERILSVRWRLPGSTRQWDRVSTWNFLRDADTDDFSTGKAVEVLNGLYPNASIRVTYAKEPGVLSDADDDFEDVTGLPLSCWDVVVLGVSARLAPNLDLARLPVDSVEADELDQPKPIGSASQVAQVFKREFTERLAEEAQRMTDKYPVQFRRER